MSIGLLYLGLLVLGVTYAAISGAMGWLSDLGDSDVQVDAGGDLEAAHPHPISGTTLATFVTGFGGPGTFRQDLTCLGPMLRGKQKLRLYISTYSKPGWIAGAALEFSAEGVGYRRPAFAKALFNEPQVTGRAARLDGSIVIPPGLGRPRLRILSTGHATDGGPEHEFIASRTSSFSSAFTRTRSRPRPSAQRMRFVPS